MKVTIEIPVDIDGPLTADERKKLKEYIGEALEPILKHFLTKNPWLNSDPRVFGTVCRFRFMAPKAKVE